MDGVRGGVYASVSYTVTYKDFHTGELVRKKRYPPKKIHELEVGDQVRLKENLGEGWQQGHSYELKSYGVRQPNILQLQGRDGSSKFVSCYQVEGLSSTPSNSAKADKGKYLFWP